MAKFIYEQMKETFHRRADHIREGELAAAASSE
jgi:hypothetical protein